MLSHLCRTAIATLSLCCRSAVTPLSHRYCSALAPPLSLRCRYAVAPLLHQYCSTVALLLSLLLLLRSRTAIAPVLLHCRYPAVAPAVATLLHPYRTGIALLSLRCCCSCCRYAVAPLLLHCRTVVEPLSLLPREDIKNSKLNCCCSTVTPLSLLLSIRRFTRLSPQEA